MPDREDGFTPEIVVAERKPLARLEVEEILARGEDLDGLYLIDADLSELPLEGKSFRGADVRAMTLYREGQSAGTDIRRTNWTDAVMGDAGAPTVFTGVNAEGAIFGYTEGVEARRERHQAESVPPREQDVGAILNFIGDLGNFKRTTWANVDFMGFFEGYEARFVGADFSGALFIGCDLTMIDFSKARLTGVVIRDPVSLEGMKISRAQVKSILRAIQFSDAEWQAEYEAKVATLTPAEVFAVYGVEVI